MTTETVAKLVPNNNSRERPDLNRLPRLLTTKQLAAFLGVHPRTIKRMVAESALPGIVRPFGRTLRFDRLAVEDWISRGCPKIIGSYAKRRPWAPIAH